MPFHRLVVGALTLLVVATPALTSVAVAAEHQAPGRQRPEPAGPGAERRAQQALAAVEAAFAGSGQVPPGIDPGARGTSPEEAHANGRAVTPLLLELRRALSALPPADRQRAQAYLARPTDDGEPFGASYSPRARPTSDCRQEPEHTRPICVHWARRTGDAPRRADRDGDGIPNQVEKTSRIMTKVWRRVVTEGGYKAPLPDGRGPKGHRRKLDVYLVDIGDQGVFGYCNTETRVDGSDAYTGYCVLDEDYSFSEFPFNTPNENLKVTATHEFFHAVQFAYDALEDLWFMESTATWVEDEVFDAINDNRFYLQRSMLTAPETPLDTGSGLYVYGNWIWWRFLTELFPEEEDTRLPVLVRDVWERADDSDPAAPGTYSVDALDHELGSRYEDLGTVLAEFGVANRRPASSYEEGADYPQAPSTRAHLLSASATSVPPREVLMSHLSNATVVFRPDASLGSGWTLDLTLDLPTPDLGFEPHATVVVVHRTGPPEVRTVALDPATGDATVSGLPFDQPSVERVELSLTNAGHRYNCWQGKQWACRGEPLDDGLSFGYEATTQQ